MHAILALIVWTQSYFSIDLSCFCIGRLGKTYLLKKIIIFSKFIRTVDYCQNIFKKLIDMMWF